MWDTEYWKEGEVDYAEASIRFFIILLLFENLIDVTPSMKDADYPQNIGPHDVNNQNILEALHWPEAKACEGRILEQSGRADLWHLAECFNRLVDSVKGAHRLIESLLHQVVPKLPDDVILCSWADDLFHAFFFRRCFPRSKASALRSFQKARFSGISSPPDARPSIKSVSSLASSSRCHQRCVGPRRKQGGSAHVRSK